MKIYLFFLQAQIIDDLVRVFMRTKSIWATLIIGVIFIFTLIFHRKYGLKFEEKIIENTPEYNEKEKPKDVIIEETQNYIRNGNLEKAIQLITEQLEMKSNKDDNYESLYRDSLLVSNRFRRLNHSKVHNLLDTENLLLEENRINNTVLELVAGLKKFN